MLVETGGVWVYTPGRGNLKASKRGERDKVVSEVSIERIGARTRGSCELLEER